MRTYVIAVIGLVAILATIGLVTAGYGSGNGPCDQESFIDEDGDGVCDNWVGANGDGMNDLRPMDGSGYQYRYGRQQEKSLCSGNGSGFGPGKGVCQNE